MSADQIQVISTSTIKIDSTARINLTPWDLELLFLEYIQMGLLFLMPNNKTTTPSLIHHLKSSLQRTLHFFPPLAGRLATTESYCGAATCFSIDCNEGGALFVHATLKNLTVADILNPSTYVPEIVHSFFPLTGVGNYDTAAAVSPPLLAVQVTELADGLFVGCSVNHLAGDGASFWHFVNSWAEISRGEISIISSNNNNIPISKLPFLSRNQVNLDLVGSSRISVGSEHLMLDDIQVTQPIMRLLREKVFHLSKQSVAKLKAKANQEIPESKGKISSLQAVIAHLWRSIIRCRFATNSRTKETTSFEIPMNVRQRLNPPLPEEYFGNAIIPGIVTLEAGKIMENSMGWTAWKINRMLAACSDSGKVREFCVSWVKKPKFLESYGLPSNYFVLINSPRFDVYGNDFGWGKPVAMRGGGSDRFDGRITISGGLMEEGSMEIEVCLIQESLGKLAEDVEFMEFVT